MTIKTILADTIIQYFRHDCIEFSLANHQDEANETLAKEIFFSHVQSFSTHKIPAVDLNDDTSWNMNNKFIGFILL